MIEKTRALCLRLAPFGNTSHVVSWLTEDYGLRSTVIKGARRPKSPFLGQYDLYYTCELLFYRRERSGAHIARECFPLAPRQRLRENWRAAAVASYLCDLFLGGHGVGNGDGAGFETLETALDALDAGRPPIEVMLWCETRLLCLGGWAPRLEACEACLREGRRNARRFSLSEGRLVCDHAPRNGGSEDTVAMPESVRARLEAWKKSPVFPEETAPGTEDLLGVRRFLGMFLAVHQEPSGEVRVKTLELLSWTASGA